MRTFTNRTQSSIYQSNRVSCFQFLLLALLMVSGTGCSILHPLRGMPASYLPPEYEGARRSGKRTINPSLLVQTPPEQHRIAAGDVLSIYIPGVLGRQEAEVRQFGVEPPINQPHTPSDPPTIGYPITVRGDHTVSLPQIAPINVFNMTLGQAEQAIRAAYTVESNILQPDEAMILVSLQRPRVHRVLVVRQETGNELASSNSGAGTINIGVSKRGTARVVTLNAYENDVLHALSTENGVDGLPGLDAENTIYIIRRRPAAAEPQQMVAPPGQLPYRPTPAIPAQQYPGGFGANTAKPASFNSSIQLVQHVQSSGGAAPSPFAGSNIRSGGHTFTANVQASPSTLTPGMHPQTSSANPFGYQQNSTAGPTMNHVSYPQGTQSPPSPVAQPGMSFPSQSPMGSQWNPPSTYDMNGDWSMALDQFDPTIDNPNVIKIPIRLAPGENPNINEEMIKLYDGDIVFIESRETDVFYTGGLLGGGQYTLPREYDLGILEAISIAEGRNVGTGASRSIGGVSALNRDVSISASRVIIFRTLATGQRINIEVDLHKAMRCPEENILVQPGDILVLQYTTGEAIAAFTQRYLLEGALFSLAASQFNSGSR